MASTQPEATRPGSPTATPGPVLFAFDGSDVAEYAVRFAATQLAPGREALVLCVWQPADVGFTPTSPQHFDANNAAEVEKAAAETAARGAALAVAAGFRAQSATAQTAPTWKGIVTTAADRGASLIVIGAHRHTGLVGHLLGSVATSVVAHAPGSVLVVHQRG